MPKIIDPETVAADVKLRTIGEGPTPHFYRPFAQVYEPAMTLIVTSRGEQPEAMTAVRRALAGVSGSPQAFFPRTLDQQVDLALAPARLAAGTVIGYRVSIYPTRLSTSALPSVSSRWPSSRVWYRHYTRFIFIPAR